MAAIVNLRTARKAKARDKAATQAASNRAAFGRTRAEKQASSAEAARNTALVDGAKLDR
ncbi:MAG: DUF4169 family protein [Sphingomonas sp.]|nr:DUF4169 family protein [Sphingomonas sp.]